MKIGIIGNAADKFTKEQEQKVKLYIVEIILRFTKFSKPPTIVSGHCHLGGVDIWAEEIGELLNCKLEIKTPLQKNWTYYKLRNLEIAKSSDELYIILSEKLPPNYTGMRFDGCYHCKNDRPPHVKSGACWTGIKALELHKKVTWVII